MKTLYDTIGLNYANLRQPDLRISQRLQAALGQAKTVLNVGAGTGSYEPADRQVTALEPSAEMIQQRNPSTAKIVQGFAENIPFADHTFDASMAILTIHHWSNQKTGVLEMKRVSRNKVVFLTYDPSFPGFWLTHYFPALVTLDQAQMPELGDYEKWLGPVKLSSVPIPHDCSDGFLAGYWQRPAAYLDEKVRAAMSSFWALDNVSDGLEKLDRDLKSGEWRRRYAHLLDLDELDCGYILVETI